MLHFFTITQRSQSRQAHLALVVLAVLSVTLFLVLAVSEPALAGSGTQALQQGGTNVGNALLAWGKALLFAVAAIMGIGALVKRSVGEGVTILVIVLILGAFLYDQADATNVIHNVWGAIGG